MSHTDSCCSGTSEEGEFSCQERALSWILRMGKKSGRREEAEGLSTSKVR